MTVRTASASEREIAEETGEAGSRLERAGAEKQEANLVQFGRVIIPRGEREEEEDGHQKKVGLKTRTGMAKGILAFAALLSICS